MKDSQVPLICAIFLLVVLLATNYQIDYQIDALIHSNDASMHNIEVLIDQFKSARDIAQLFPSAF